MLIALIGDEWLTAADENGNRRLDNPKDFVRIEISTALKRGIRVIPVLVTDAVMPKARDLPNELVPLTERNALEIRHGSFDAGIEKLQRAIDSSLRETQIPKETFLQRVPLWAWISTFGLILLISFAIVLGSKLNGGLTKGIDTPKITAAALTKETETVEQLGDPSTDTKIVVTEPANSESDSANLVSETASVPDPSSTVGITSVAITPIPEELAALDTPSQIPTEQPKNELLLPNSPIPDNLRIITANNADQLKEVARWEIQKSVYGAAYSSTGNRIALGLNQEVLILDAQNGEVVSQLIDPDKIQGNIRYLAFNREGDQIVLAPDPTYSTGKVQIWNINDGELYNVAALEKITSFALSSDRTRCAIGLQIWTSRIYECFPAARYSGQMGPHTNAAWVMAIDFSPSGTYLASVGSYGEENGDGKGDGAVRLWSGQTYQQVARLNLEKMLFSLKFSPKDDQLLAVSSEDGVVDFLQVSIADDGIIQFIILQSLILPGDTQLERLHFRPTTSC